MQIVDKANLEFYETHLAEADHIMPNVNTVRCDLWYFQKNRKPGKLMDFGFGYGQELLYFADQGYDVYGLDVVQSAKDKIDAHIAKNRPELKDNITTAIMAADATSLPYEDATFDFIHSNQTMSHLPSGDAIKVVLNEWYRIMKPGGMFMFSTMNPANTIIQTGKLVGENLYESEYGAVGKGADGPKMTMHNYLMEDEASIRKMCDMFTVDEVGWFTNHYCGIDGTWWQVLGRKA